MAQLATKYFLGFACHTVAWLVVGALSMQKCVLVIEDNPINMRLFWALLASDACYEVLTAVNGSRGLELARERHPDLIIMDIQLPDLSGLDVTCILKANDDTRGIPIVAVTAYAMPEDETRIRASGCDGLLLKPFTIAQFRAMLRSFLAPLPGAG